jgi:replicative DNA helicase
MSETELNARTAGSQPAVQKSTDRLTCDWDDSTDDSTTQAPDGEDFFNSPPHNREAEEAVLGSVLINPEVYDDLAEFLSHDDFYILRNDWVWQAFARLRELGQPIDYLTVVNDLQEHNRLAEIGGPAHLMGLINQTPSSLHAVAYGHLVEQVATCRRLAQAANRIATAAYRKPQDANKALDEAEQAVFNVSLRRVTREVQSAQTMMSNLYDQVADQADGCLKGIPTGFIDLDRLLGGLHGSDLIIVGSRPAVGKTSFLTSLALQVAEKVAKHIAVFSLEMSTEQLALRLAAQESGIDSQRLRSGQLKEDEWEMFTRAVEKLSELPIHFDDSPALTPSQLRSKCRKLRLQNRLDLVVVDYLQLMASDGRFENRVQEVGYISRQLKVLARELDVPILAAAQLSRAVEMRSDKRPVLSDLRESGNLEMDADIVLFLHRLEDPAEKGLTEVIVAKHRQGPTGVIRLAFQESTARFVNAVVKED